MYFILLSFSLFQTLRDVTLGILQQINSMWIIYTHVSHFDNEKERFVLDRPLPLQSRTLISFDDLCLFLNIECELGRNWQNFHYCTALSNSWEMYAKCHFLCILDLILGNWILMLVVFSSSCILLTRKTITKTWHRYLSLLLQSSCFKI